DASGALLAPPASPSRRSSDLVVVLPWFSEQPGDFSVQTLIRRQEMVVPFRLFPQKPLQRPAGKVRQPAFVRLDFDVCRADGGTVAAEYRFRRQCDCNDRPSAHLMPTSPNRRTSSMVSMAS